MNIGNGRVTLFSIFLIFVLDGRFTDAFSEHFVSLRIKPLGITAKVFYEYTSMMEKCQVPAEPVLATRFSKAEPPQDEIFEFEMKCLQHTAQNKDVGLALVSLLMKYWSLKYGTFLALLWYKSNPEITNSAKSVKDIQSSLAYKQGWMALYLLTYGLRVPLDLLLQTLREKTPENKESAAVIKQVETSFVDLELIKDQVAGLQTFIETKKDIERETELLDLEKLTNALIQLDTFFTMLLYEPQDVKAPSVYYENKIIETAGYKLLDFTLPTVEYKGGRESVLTDIIRDMAIYVPIAEGETIEGTFRTEVFRYLGDMKDKNMKLHISPDGQAPIYRFIMDY